MRNCICLWVINEDLSKTLLSSDTSFLFHDTFNLKALPPKEAWLFFLPFYEFREMWWAKVALLIFLCLPIRLVGHLDPLGCSCFWKTVWLGIKGFDEHQESGEMAYGSLLVLETSGLPASCGKRVQFISIDLVSRDVFQRVNVFIGFLSFCC